MIRWSRLVAGSIYFWSYHIFDFAFDHQATIAILSRLPQPRKPIIGLGAWVEVKVKEKFMPKIADSVYEQYYTAILAQANRDGGVSRKEIMDEIKVSRILADSLIDRLKLKKIRTEGRTEFFGPTKGTTKVAEEAGVAAPSVPENPETTVAALVTEPTSTAETPKKKRGRPKKGESNGSASAAPAAAAPAASTLSASEAAAKVKELRAAIAEALEKSKRAQQEAIEQSAMAKALESKLALVLAQSA